MYSTHVAQGNSCELRGHLPVFAIGQGNALVEEKARGARIGRRSNMRGSEAKQRGGARSLKGPSSSIGIFPNDRNHYVASAGIADWDFAAGTAS
jgi:hypothetical protein